MIKLPAENPLAGRLEVEEDHGHRECQESAMKESFLDCPPLISSLQLSDESTICTMVQEYRPTDLLTPGLEKDDVALAGGRGCPNPPVSVTSINSLIPWVVLPMVELPGSGLISDRGPAMPARRSRCSTMPCLSTGMFLPPRMWLLCGRHGQEMRRRRRTTVGPYLSTIEYTCFHA